VTGAGDLSGPLRAGGVHEQDVAFKAHGGHALHRNTDSRFPREIHLARRQRRRAEQLRKRAGKSIAERLHISSLSFAMRLLLASASPRRADLLRAAGFDFDTLAVDIDEGVRAGETPDEYVRRLASEKSSAGIAAARGDIVVLGADTVVVVDGAILGKPRDEDDARRMIGLLSGRRHDVLTGLSLRRGGRELARVVTTAVFFARMSTAEVAWYVQSGEGRDKAGANAIQGMASRFVERIEGSYSNVVGLPVAVVHALLDELDVM
jgi:septum formation protein